MSYLGFELFSEALSFSDEKRAAIVTQLRRLADHIETDSCPYLIKYVSRKDELFQLEVIMKFSMPWGG